VSIKRVVIQSDLGVDRDYRFFPVRGFDDAERIDLDQRRIAFPPGFVNAEQQPGRRID
jgi:hypothetical protein